MRDLMDGDEQCPHVTLKRKNVGNSHWYACDACGQKFKAQEWDGKVVVEYEGWQHADSLIKSIKDYRSGYSCGYSDAKNGTRTADWSTVFAWYTSHLPKFEKMKPVGTIYTSSLNLPPQDFRQGFPGVTSRFEWFAIDV